MRERGAIERQLSRADNGFNGGSDAVSQELILEVLLDIRDLLTSSKQAEDDTLLRTTDEIK